MDWSDDDPFNPRRIIAAVNALQPLGKKLGVAVLDEYLHVNFDSWWNGDEGLILVMRALFEVPPAVAGISQSQPASEEGDPFVIVHPGYFRPPMLGAPDWYPKNLVDFPRFPLVIVEDIPLLSVSGYSLGGEAEPAEEHLRYLRNSASWRSRPLIPSNDPLRAEARFTAMVARYQHREETFSPMIAGQLLRLIDTVYREPPKEDEDEYVPPEQAAASFAEAIKKVRALNIHWDRQLNCYVRGDGTLLPPIIVTEHH